jgi:hypothetical protein
MLADLERLIELQQVDLRLLELRRQIETFPRQRAHFEQELARARDAVADRRTRHTESLKERKRLELDVQQLEEKVKKHRDQMFEVKSNEAYRALQHEVEEEQKRKSQAEDKVLEAMIAAEELEKGIKAAQAELAQVEQRVAASLRALDAEKSEREKEAAELAARRDELRGALGEDTLIVYDRIARAHDGLALAEARDEVCQVCRIHIRPQTFAELKRGDEMHFCESCHRILYYLPAPKPDVVQAVSPSS